MKKNALSAIFTLVILTISLNSLADVSEATFIPQGSDVYQSVPVEEVELYVYKPKFAFKVIGAIEARGMAEIPSESLFDQLDIIHQLTKDPTSIPSEKEDIALAIKALKEEAARVGANGVIILSSRQVRVSQNSTERRLQGAAIRRVP